MTATIIIKKWGGRVFRLVRWAVPIAILIALIENLGYLYGAYGFAGIILIFTIYRIVTRWKSFMNGVKMAETSYFGKPLEKKYWRKDEKPKLFRRKKRKE